MIDHVLFARRRDRLITQLRNTMTKNEFYGLCSMLYILADEALKNPRVLRALRNHEGYDEIAQILQEEFDQQ